MKHQILFEVVTPEHLGDLLASPAGRATRAVEAIRRFMDQFAARKGQHPSGKGLMLCGTCETEIPPVIVKGDCIPGCAAITLLSNLKAPDSIAVGVLCEHCANTKPFGQLSREVADRIDPHSTLQYIADSPGVVQ